MTQANVIDRLFGTMQDCDTSTVRDCLTKDAIIWHSFDKKPMDVEAVVAAWEGMAQNFTECAVADVRRQQTPSGYVQQHVFVVRMKDGTRKAWPVCIVVQVQGGQIARLDEYIDMSAGFDPGEGDVVAPGL